MACPSFNRSRSHSVREPVGSHVGRKIASPKVERGQHEAAEVSDDEMSSAPVADVGKGERRQRKQRSEPAPVPHLGDELDSEAAVVQSSNTPRPSTEEDRFVLTSFRRRDGWRGLCRSAHECAVILLGRPATWIASSRPNSREEKLDRSVRLECPNGARDHEVDLIHCAAKPRTVMTSDVVHESHASISTRIFVMKGSFEC
jgi:hypothetical protein